MYGMEEYKKIKLILKMFFKIGEFKRRNEVSVNFVVIKIISE